MKWIKKIVWLAFVIAVIIGMSLSRSAQENTASHEPLIFVQVDGENNFLTQKELRTRLVRKGYIKPDQAVKDIRIQEIETYLTEMSEISSARVYRSLGKYWNIDVVLRKPIARVFNLDGESYYVDSQGHKMALSHNHTARVLVFTGQIKDKLDNQTVELLINNDSLKTIQHLDEIYRISNYVCNDPFLNAQLGQVHRKTDGDFVLIPQVGDHTILFGKANSNREVEKKFKKLVLFYQEGLPYEGWNKYSEINLKYDKQIVCKKKII